MTDYGQDNYNFHVKNKTRKAVAFGIDDILTLLTYRIFAYQIIPNISKIKTRNKFDIFKKNPHQKQ